MGAADVSSSPAEDDDLEPTGDGCGQLFAGGKDVWIDVVARGYRRSARVYGPSRYDPEKRYPLVVTLQPSYIDEAHYARRSGLAGIAITNEMFVVAVTTADRFAPWTDEGDITVIRAAVRDMVESFCIDRSRIFASGHGAGGRMARELACAMPLSAIAASGSGELIDTPSCESSPPVPMIYLAGTEDPYFPLAGGTGCAGGDFLSANQHDERWKARNGCTGEPREFLRHADGKCDVWACTGGSYASCRIRGGHHLKETSWSMLAPLCEARPLQMMLGSTIWKFFKEHGRELPVGSADHDERNP